MQAIEAQPRARTIGDRSVGIERKRKLISQLIERPSLRQARTDAAVANERGSEHLLSSTRNELKARTQRLAYEWLWRQAEAAEARTQADQNWFLARDVQQGADALRAAKRKRP